MKFFLKLFTGLSLWFFCVGCGVILPITRYDPNQPHLISRVEIMSNSYSAKDIYSVYQKASNRFTPMQSLRNEVINRIANFASQQGKSYVILGEESLSPSNVLINFPRIEIVFAIIEKEKVINSSTGQDKLSKLEKLKKLFDGGALTKDEYDNERKKILEEKN